jgi:hypothetical protein
MRRGALRHRSPRAILETVALTLAFPAIGFALDRNDPFFLSQRFPWVVLAPMLISLRHGFLLGLSCALFLDTGLAVAWRAQLLPMGRFPGGMMVGLVGIAMFCGQFSDVWKREIVRLDAGFKQLRRQRDELARGHFLLELSHDRLEQHLAGQLPSLRDALAGARELAQSTARAPSDALAQAMLDIFATYCMVEVASLYWIQDGTPAAHPAAVVGRPDAVRHDDPLVARALASGRLTYAAGATDEDREEDASHLLAALPLLDMHGRTHLILCVQSIPFFAFEPKNLQALSLLAGNFADLLATRGRETDLERGRRHEFEIRLARAVRDAQQHGVPSTVAVLVVRPGSPVGEIVDTLLGGALEAADVPYAFRDPNGQRYVFILLPAADERGAAALDQRLRRIVERELRTTLQGAGVSYSAHPLRTRDQLAAIMRLLGDVPARTTQEEEPTDALGQARPPR